MLPTPFSALAFTLAGCNFLVGPKGVELREVVTARMSEFAPSICDGISLVGNVKKKIGRGGYQGDNVDYFRSTAVRFRCEDDTGEVRINREGRHLPAKRCQSLGIIQCP